MAPSTPFPMQKLNFAVKGKEDAIKNLKLFQLHLKKLKMPFVVDSTSIANGRFQNNMEVVQFLYDQQQKYAPRCALFYSGFERRLDGYKKQVGAPADYDLPISKVLMNSHLIPTNSELRP